MNDESPDDTFYSKISNQRKVDYICKALRIARPNFHLDLPLPMEDWSTSDDLSLINSGLYLADLRRQFYERLLSEQPGLERERAWLQHAEAEYWNHEFNAILAKRTSGSLLADPRVRH